MTGMNWCSGIRTEIPAGATNLNDFEVVVRISVCASAIFTHHMPLPPTRHKYLHNFFQLAVIPAFAGMTTLFLCT
jgi:hypothetical protein